jgi:Bacterial Ig-like domain (group 3)
MRGLAELLSRRISSSSWRRGPHYRRTALLLGAGTLVAAASVLGVTEAHAVVGTQLGDVSFSPNSGPVTATGIRYITTTACPATHQGSGVIRIINPATGRFANLAPVDNSVAAPFSGTFNATFALAGQLFPGIVGHQAEVAVYCFTGRSATGTSIPVQYTFVTISGNGSTYRETNNGQPPPSTNGHGRSSTTELTVSPSPALVGQVVTLTAHVAPSSATGSVQFSVGGTGIGSPVTVTDGWAATTTSFTAASTEVLSAEFTPAGNFRGSTASFNQTVNAAPPNTGIIPIAVTIPATGSFTLTVDTITTVALTVNGNTAAAATSPIVVSDTRNTFPGWSVSAQDTESTGSGTTISGNQLGWTPISGTSPLPPGVTLGGPVIPASPGLAATPAVLALVHAGLYNGYGTATLGADLTLAITTSDAVGRYTSGLSITSVSANP